MQMDEGVSGRAVIERRVIRTGDYLADAQFTHAEAPDRYIRQHGIRSVMSAPLIGEDGAIGSLTVHSQTRDAFDQANAELLEVLASQAAIAVTNARLYEQLRERVDAQQALAAISAEIAALHDPATVLQRTAEEALRLLRADTAIINPLEDNDALLGWPIAYAPADGAADDIPVRMGEGISGRAMSERRVMRTGDYLADAAFDHTPDLDEYIRRRGMRSVMTAPLMSSAGGLGALTVQAERANAFDEADAELLRVLADQAAIAITNARLYDELGEESAALARQTDSQQRLLQINERLLRTLDPASVLELIADGLKSVVWYDNFSIYRADDEMRILNPVLARDRNARGGARVPDRARPGPDMVEHRASRAGPAQRRPQRRADDPHPGHRRGGGGDDHRAAHQRRRGHRRHEHRAHRRRRGLLHRCGLRAGPALRRTGRGGDHQRAPRRAAAHPGRRAAQPGRDRRADRVTP